MLPSMRAGAAVFSLGAQLIGGFAGTVPEDAGVQAFAQRARAGEVGGAVLFSYNIENPAQLRRLTQYLQDLEIPPSHRPLLIMVDQEGGRVQRLSQSKGFVPTPSAQALGREPQAVVAAHAQKMAAQLAAAGINVNCAPVLDIASDERSVIGRAERSFGADASQVARCARLFVEAHAAAGIATSLKHFPGLGGATGDTHAGLVDATAHAQHNALDPFAALIDADPLVAVMSTHMVDRNLEPSGAPLTFSRNAMHGLLREQLKFSGVLISDDLRMGAIAKHFDLGHTVVAALAAGHDLLMFGENRAAMGDGSSPAHSPVQGLWEQASHAVADGVARGALDPVALERSAARVAAWRQRLRQHAN